VLESPKRPSIEEIAQTEGEGLFRFLHWSLGHREDALDAVQEVLIRVHRSLDDLRDVASFKHWLYRIATNVARDARSRRRRTPRPLGEPIEDDAHPAVGNAGEPTPFAELQARETDQRLTAAVASLAPELREPLLMHVVSGMKYREIAEALGWPMGTVTTRIHVARKELARLLGDS
jgi:RNA polymerase sigma-70 factor (ECF subfamily)